MHCKVLYVKGNENPVLPLKTKGGETLRYNVQDVIKRISSLCNCSFRIVDDEKEAADLKEQSPPDKCLIMKSVLSRDENGDTELSVEISGVVIIRQIQSVRDLADPLLRILDL